jgi:hypothetical protein
MNRLCEGFKVDPDYDMTTDLIKLLKRQAPEEGYECSGCGGKIDLHKAVCPTCGKPL